jgi:hypothetical protein
VSQVELYESVVVPLLNSCLEGYNATTLAYGQTGAGKYDSCVMCALDVLLARC